MVSPFWGNLKDERKFSLFGFWLSAPLLALFTTTFSWWSTSGFAVWAFASGSSSGFAAWTVASGFAAWTVASGPASRALQLAHFLLGGGTLFFVEFSVAVLVELFEKLGSALGEFLAHGASFVFT